MAGGVVDLYSLLKFYVKRHLMGQSGETSQKETEDGNIGRRRRKQKHQKGTSFGYIC